MEETNKPNEKVSETGVKLRIATPEEHRAMAEKGWVLTFRPILPPSRSRADRNKEPGESQE